MYQRTNFPTLFDLPSLLAVPFLAIAGLAGGLRRGIALGATGLLLGIVVGLGCLLATLACLAGVHRLLNRFPRLEPVLLTLYVAVAVAIPSGFVGLAFTVMIRWL